MKRYVILAACAATLAAIPIAVDGQATQSPQKPTVVRETAEKAHSYKGDELFQQYCAVCHGKSAKGDGPAAAALKKPPADLTTISKRHNGQFPRKTVEDTILGTNEAPSAAHGTRDMPIWGPIFRRSGDRDVVTLMTANLVNYIQGLQVK
jgi:mono/diheme cytochrome c family protein